MKSINFTDFRRKASHLITEVEQGERLILLRHGKPVAEIVPIENNNDKTPAWKRPVAPLEMKGQNLSSAILEERETNT